jgi:hypothetical protein
MMSATAPAEKGVGLRFEADQDDGQRRQSESQTQ